MATQIFINLPVKDLDKSIAFFTAIGYTFNPQFTNASATCMIVSDTIYVMLLVEQLFQSFTDKAIPDGSKASEVILAITADSKEEVDTIVNKAIAAGGTTPKPIQDLGWMYQWGYQDLDGHLWEVFWMNPAGMPQN